MAVQARSKSHLEIGAVNDRMVLVVDTRVLITLVVIFIVDLIVDVLRYLYTKRASVGQQGG